MSKAAELHKLVWDTINSVYDDTVAIRRHIHQNPEVSGNEYKTAAFISSKLTALNIPHKKYIDKTAVVATLKNGEGPLVVLRADIDALPIEEDTGLAYSSVNTGVMHACGHDMHTACLLGAADVLGRLKSKWRGTLVFLFQPMEEIEPGGAWELIECGAYPKNADAVFGLHVNADHETGTVGVKRGIDYAGVLAFDILVEGKGGHGGTPEATIDPVICASSLVLQMQSIVSREKSPFFPAVLTIGCLNAGTRRNIIPETATLSGTIRCHSSEYLQMIQGRLTELVVSGGHAFRCDATVTFEKPYPPVNNNMQMSERFVNAFVNLAGKERFVERPLPTMYAEDFSYYQEKTPGLYVHLGVRPKKKKVVPALHSPHFSPDETAVSTGIACHVCFALDMMKAVS
jgi:amidohydrolase